MALCWQRTWGLPQARCLTGFRPRPGRGPRARPPTYDERAAYRKLCAQNVTCFNDHEQSHPIDFFEQHDVCAHCGAERFVTSSQKVCCHDGQLVLSRFMPPDLLALISKPPGLSKQSRAANDLFRFAQMALPKDTHRIPDSYQHLKITGVPFAIVNHVNERSSARSFLDDPYERVEDVGRYCADVRRWPPSPPVSWPPRRRCARRARPAAGVQI